MGESKKKRTRAYGTGSIFKRGKYYWIQYHVRGRSYRESSESMAHGDAVDLLRQRLKEIEARGYAHLKPTSFDDLVGLLRADYKRRNRKSLKRAEQCVAHLRKFFGNVLATDISRERMSAYFEKRDAEGAARATIRQELAILGRMLTLAVQDKRLHARPPVPSISFDNVRTGFFEDADIERVIGFLPDHLKSLVRFLALTGWRKSEAVGLTWAEIDWAEGTVRLAGSKTKNGQPRVLPFTLSPSLAGLFNSQWGATQALQRERGAIVQHVFHKAGKRIGDFRDSWATACRKAGVPGRLVHDLRRSAVRRYEQRGVPRSVAMQITGHRTESIYKRYAVTSTADVAEALATADPGTPAAEISTRSTQRTASGTDPEVREGA